MSRAKRIRKEKMKRLRRPFGVSKREYKSWAPKIFLITLALILGGCSQTIATYKDGVATVKRNRFLITEDIGSFSYDATDGSFTLDEYKSDMTRALILIDKLAKKEDDEIQEIKP